MPSPSPTTSYSGFAEWKVLVVTTLTSVATIIGSGILALPVTLYDASILSFLLYFTVCLLGEACAVYATVELLQRAQAVANVKHRAGLRAGVYGEQPDSIAQQGDEEDSGGEDISLYNLAEKYLPNRALQVVFHIFSLLTFVSLLVSYGLAGPQAISQLFSLSAETDNNLILTLSFAGAGILGVVLFVDFLLPWFSALTLVKGGLFVGVAVVVLCLPSELRVYAPTDPALYLSSATAQQASLPVSFLMSTVALGCLAITTPVTFRLLPSELRARSPNAVGRFRAAVLAGLVLCYALNIAWVIAIMQVVPRTPDMQSAFDSGDITTVPLIKRLHNASTTIAVDTRAVELVTQLFIIVSTAVSFFVMAAGCKNYVDGFLSHYSQSQQCSWSVDDNNGRFRGSSLRVLAYVMTFAPIVVLIIANPKGFIAILSRLSSMAINVQTGLMILVMLYFCHRSPNDRGSEEQFSLLNTSGNRENAGIALPMSRSATRLCLVLGSAFFGFAALVAAVGPMFGIKLA